MTGDGLLAGLAVGGRKRLDALDKLKLAIRTDAGRQVAEMQANGWDQGYAVKVYREWLHDWCDDAVNEFAEWDAQ